MDESTHVDKSLEALLAQRQKRVQSVLNILLESSYFYRTDSEDDFLFLKRYRREFERFFERYFGWQLKCDAKCARLYKEHWYNDAVTQGSRSMFNFTRRDECIAFMLLLEFYENRLEEESIPVEDPVNLHFRYGDLLHYVRRRFVDLYPENEATYTEEYVRANILRPVMPQLEKYRFIKKLPPPEDIISVEYTIYEALPALSHYSVTRLSRSILDQKEESEGAEMIEEDDA